MLEDTGFGVPDLGAVQQLWRLNFDNPSYIRKFEGFFLKFNSSEI